MRGASPHFTITILPVAECGCFVVNLLSDAPERLICPDTDHEAAGPEAIAFPREEHPLPALALQCEHRGGVGVLGSVLDVIDADRFIRTCPPDERPSGCSITSVIQPLCVAGFPKKRGGEEQGRSSLFDLLSPEQCCFHLRRSQSQDVRHLARTHVACHDHSRVCGARRPIRLRNVCARQRRVSLPRHSSR